MKTSHEPLHMLHQMLPNCGVRPTGGTVIPLGWSCLCEGHINFCEIWAQDKMCISVEINLLQVSVLNYKQHILSPVKVRKLCYSVAELYVKYD
jgi:hypothetical protein